MLIRELISKIISQSVGYKKMCIAHRAPLKLRRSQLEVVEAAFWSVNYLVSTSGVFNLQMF